MSGRAWTMTEKRILENMRREGCTYSQIAERIGRTEHAVKTYALHYADCPRKKNGGNTLCWTCINAVPNPQKGHGCSWSRKLIPVKGWTAEGTILKCYATSEPKKYTCYRVMKCPEFVEG